MVYKFMKLYSVLFVRVFGYVDVRNAGGAEDDIMHSCVFLICFHVSDTLRLRLSTPNSRWMTVRT